MVGNRRREVERQLGQATRLVAAISDHTTYLIEELRRELRGRATGWQCKEEIRARARELWEQHGRPTNRDLEFWLEAERECNGDGKG
jgi:Protein of unknown function (DUF2934)